MLLGIEKPRPAKVIKGNGRVISQLRSSTEFVYREEEYGSVIAARDAPLHNSRAVVTSTFRGGSGAVTHRYVGREALFTQLCSCAGNPRHQSGRWRETGGRHQPLFDLRRSAVDAGDKLLARLLVKSRAVGKPAIEFMAIYANEIVTDHDL